MTLPATADISTLPEAIALLQAIAAHLRGDVVPTDGGLATDGMHGLGSAASPWGAVHAASLVIGGTAVSASDIARVADGGRIDAPLDGSGRLAPPADGSTAYMYAPPETGSYTVVSSYLAATIPRVDVRSLQLSEGGAIDLSARVASAIPGTALDVAVILVIRPAAT